MNRMLCKLVAVAAMVVVVAGAGAQLPDRPDRDKVVFAYLQSPTSTDVRGVRWHALTHVGWSFISFNASAALSGTSAFQTRSAELLPGGVAANNGVKVIAVLANADFDESILDAVMRSPSLRSTLINNVVSLVGHPTTGCDGVNLDFEFSWDATTRDGMMIFIQDLQVALKALNPPRELSIYTTPTWSSTRYDAAVLQNHTDYVIYSGYDFASGNTMTAIGRYGSPSIFSIVRNLDAYMSAGISADHLVLALPFYARSWTTDAAGTYGDVGSSPVSRSVIDTNFDTTWRSPVLTKNYSVPENHHGVWYKRDQGGGVWHLYTFDDAQTMEYKMRLVNAWQGNVNTGRQLRGMAFWSLRWLQNPSSVDPNNTGAGSQSLTRTVNFPYRLMEELYAPPGAREFRVETFEHVGTQTTTGFNTGWREPEDGPDDQNVDGTISTRAPAAVPAGAPAGSNRVLAVTFRFTGTPNRFFFKHQPLMGTESPFSVDWNSAIAQTDATTKFMADIHVPAGYAGTSIRMVVRDSQNQLEKGPAFLLNTAGWRRISFDLANDTIAPYATSEGGYSTGNGVINTAGNGALDIAFAGFEVSSTGFTGATGTINFDKITYTDSQPGDRRYVINEFRYAAAAQQFVEIFGPAGPFPTGMVLRAVDSATGSANAGITLTGSIPNDTGTGHGFYVVGVPGVPNVDQTMASGTLGTGSPDALQLFHPATATIHDALVYEAFSGIFWSDGPGDPLVAIHGPGWLGEVAGGGNSAGIPYTKGRYPDGANTWVNGDDFSIMPATPGVSNGNTLAVPSNFSFSTVPTTPFRTYQTFSVANPVSAGLPASPDGGNAHRAVDTSGGGTMSVFGDAALGSTAPCDVRGYVYVPTAAANHQAIGLGICVRSGSTFFSASPSASGFDSGYWLVYENRASVGLSDGQPDHPGEWHFVHATNDGRDAEISTVLGSAAQASTGIPAGQWSKFRLSINPSAPAGHQLLAKINEVEVFRGSIPAGGPTSGAFATGFRETNGGAVAADEGTWIDGLEFTLDTVPVTLSRFEVE